MDDAPKPSDEHELDRRVRPIAGFTFEPEALSQMHDILWSDLAPIEIPDAFVEPISEHSKRGLNAAASDSLRVYIDSYVDLNRLLEEMRFEVALASLLLGDYAVKRDRGELIVEPKPDMPLAVEVKALLRQFLREVPSPAELFRDPHTEIAGSRILGRWFAGQLLDSVLYRTVAGCDRLAILLWTRAEYPLEDRRGAPLYPAFTRGYVDQLAQRYGNDAAWLAFAGFLTFPLFETAKAIRNGFTHSQRIPSELHGDDVVEYAYNYATAMPRIQAIDARDHLALGLAGYDAILRPLVRLVGELLPSGRPS